MWKHKWIFQGFSQYSLVLCDVRTPLHIAIHRSNARQRCKAPVSVLFLAPCSFKILTESSSDKLRTVSVWSSQFFTVPTISSLSRDMPWSSMIKLRLEFRLIRLYSSVKFLNWALDTYQTPMAHGRCESAMKCARVCYTALWCLVRVCTTCSRFELFKLPRHWIGVM